VPFQIELLFEPGGRWQTSDARLDAQPGQSVWLRSGCGVYSHGADAIEICGGSDAHGFEYCGEGKATDAFRVVIALLTPLDHRVVLRYGCWSHADRAIRPVTAAADVPAECVVRDV